MADSTIIGLPEHEKLINHLSSIHNLNSIFPKHTTDHEIYLSILSFCTIGTILIETFNSSNASLLAFGLFCFSLLFGEQQFKLKKNVIIVLLITALTYYMSHDPISAPTFLIINPLLALHLTQNIYIAFATYSGQLFLNKFFFEPRSIGAIQSLFYNDSLFESFFSSYHLVTFATFCLLIVHFQQNHNKNKMTQTEPEVTPSTTAQSKAEENKKTQTIDIPILQSVRENSPLLIPRMASEDDTCIQTKQDLDSKADDILLMMAHECKNPLNGVQSNLELAEVLLADKSSFDAMDIKKIQSFIHKARVCGEFLLQHLNNILDAGKIESGAIEIDPKPTDLKHLLEKVWAICSESIKRKNLVGTLSLQTNVPPFLVLDSHRVVQVVTNLINNSVKFTSKGTINVIVEWENSEDLPAGKTPRNLNLARDESQGLYQISSSASINYEELRVPPNKSTFSSNLNNKLLTINNIRNLAKEYHTLDINQTQFDRSAIMMMGRFNAKKGFLTIKVNDTGCGMTQAELPRLFRKFSQLNADPLQRKIGTGLGLWLCQQICNKMNGTIEANSDSGIGSSFKVKIPTEACENPHRRSFKKLPYVSSTLSEKFDDVFMKEQVKAIVVDDLEYNRDIHKYLLKKCGCEIIGEGANGKEALSLFKEHAGKVELVVIDLEMPEMGGLEACRQIRLYEKAQNLRASYIVVISSHENKRPADEKTQLFDKYVMKPCSLNEFSKISGDALLKSMSKILSSFSPKQTISRTDKKVLIVDDDGFCLDVAKNFFTNVQIETLTAVSGPEAVEQFKKNWKNIGCILIDFEMPLMNGKQTMIEMKNFLYKQAQKVDIPIFCMSGNTSLSFMNEMKDIGFNEVFGKPLNWKKLILAVERALKAI